MRWEAQSRPTIRVSANRTIRSFDLTRRLQTSRAKQLALFEAQASDSSVTTRSLPSGCLSVRVRRLRTARPAGSMVLARPGEGRSKGSRWASRS